MHVRSFIVVEGRSAKVAIAAIVLAIFFAAFWGGSHISQSVFDGMPHVEDEHAFLYQAKVLASGRLFVPSPPYPDFFPTQFVIDYQGKRFGKYPPGYPAVLALGVIAGQPRLVNPFLGALTLVLVFLIGKELYGKLIGLLAAALGLISPFFLMISGSFLSHSTTLFFLSLFVLLFLKAGRSGNLLLPLIAGASLGMAFLTRELSAIGIALPFAVYGLIDLRRGRSALLRYGLMALAFAPFAGFLLFYNNLVTGDPFLNPYVLWWPFDNIGFAPDVGGGHTLADGWNSLQVNFLLLTNYLYGWPLRLSLVFLIVPFAMLTRQLWDWLLLGAVACLMVAYMSYWTSGEMYGPRYYFEALPMLLILTARGIVEVGQAIEKLLGRLRGSHPMAEGDGTVATRSLLPYASSLFLVPVLAIFAYGGMTGFLDEEMARFKDWYGITAEPLETAQKAGLHNALVFVYSPQWTQFAVLDVANNPDYNSDVVFAVDHDGRNWQLAQLFPGRSYYRMDGDVISPYRPPEPQAP